MAWSSVVPERGAPPIKTVRGGPLNGLALDTIQQVAACCRAASPFSFFHVRVDNVDKGSPEANR